MRFMSTPSLGFAASTSQRSARFLVEVRRSGLAPLVPALGAHPGADASAVSCSERLAGVAAGEGVDVGGGGVVAGLPDPAEQAHVPVPAVLPPHRQRDA